MTPDSTDVHQMEIPKPELTGAEVRGIVGSELHAVYQQINELKDAVETMTRACRESTDHCERYQKNTVSVLQAEIKEKDRYLNGIILTDLLKPMAKVYASMQRRAEKAENPADQKFLLNLLEDIEDAMTEDYGVEICRTKPGEHRPEYISTVKSTVLTGDESLKGTVVRSMNSSWTINGRIILKEEVTVYQYDASLAPKKEEILPKEEPSNEATSSAEESSVKIPELQVIPLNQPTEEVQENMTEETSIPEETASEEVPVEEAPETAAEGASASEEMKPEETSAEEAPTEQESTEEPVPENASEEPAAEETAEKAEASDAQSSTEEAPAEPVPEVSEVEAPDLEVSDAGIPDSEASEQEATTNHQ